jgi:hypothetical protein
MDVHDLLAQVHGLGVVDLTATVGTFSERLIEGGGHGSPTARACRAALKLVTLGDKGLAD